MSAETVEALLQFLAPDPLLLAQCAFQARAIVLEGVQPDTDAAIAARLTTDAGVTFPDEVTLSLRKVRDLRYGENPHQQAAFYAVRGEQGAMTTMEQLHGKATSFNNMLDINASWKIASDFTQPTVAIVANAPNKAGAEAFVEYLLSPAGRRWPPTRSSTPCSTELRRLR